MEHPLTCGIEIHQQLDTHKLFCSCESRLSEEGVGSCYRRLRPTTGETGEIDRVVIYYWHAKNRVEQTQVVEQLLPISKEQLTMPNKPRVREALTTVESHTYTDFAFDPSAEEVLGKLMPAYFRTVIFHALLDSAAAEHGARRRAMQSATDNAREVLDTLERTYNRVRQGSITTELNEIIGGASALEDN